MSLLNFGHFSKNNSKQNNRGTVRMEDCILSIRAESSRGGWWQQWRRRSPLPVEKRYKIIRRLCVAFSSSSYLFVYDAGVPSSIFLYETVVICFSPHGLSSPITPASLCHALLLSLYFIKALTHSLSLLLFTTTLTHTHTHTL